MANGVLFVTTGGLSPAGMTSVQLSRVSRAWRIDRFGRRPDRRTGQVQDHAARQDGQEDRQSDVQHRESGRDRLNGAVCGNHVSVIVHQGEWPIGASRRSIDGHARQAHGLQSAHGRLAGELPLGNKDIAVVFYQRRWYSDGNRTASAASMDVVVQLDYSGVHGDSGDGRGRQRHHLVHAARR